jgi:phage tail-like protein
MTAGSPPPSPGPTPGPAPAAGTPTPSPAPGQQPTAIGTPTPSPAPGQQPTAIGTPTPSPPPGEQPAVLSTPTPAPAPAAAGAPPAGTPTPSPGPGQEPTAVGTPTPSPSAEPEPLPGGTPTPSPQPAPSGGGGAGLGGAAVGGAVLAGGAIGGAEPQSTGSGDYAGGGPITPGIGSLGGSGSVSGGADVGGAFSAEASVSVSLPSVSMPSIGGAMSALAGLAIGSGDATADALITSNFILIVDGLTCGRWTDCSGLGLKYGGKDYNEGGQITASRLMDVRSSQTLTVSRPFGPASIEMLHWFELYGHIVIPLTAFVAACDYEGNVQYWWELSGVTPLQWTGPKFKAGEAAVAMETLTLNYTDFLGWGSGSAAGVIGGAITAVASIAEGVISALAGPTLTNSSGGSLSFDLVPGTFTIGGTLNTNMIVTTGPDGRKMMVVKPNTASGSAQTPPQAQGPSPRTLAFTMTLDATTVRLSGNLFANPMSAISALTGQGITAGLNFVYQSCGLPPWGTTYPTSPTAAAGAAAGAATSMANSGGNNSTPAPTVTFTWGSFNFSGIWTKFSINITRLDMLGNPLRADVDVALTEMPASTPSQNPTSGSLEVTRTHTVTAGDSLASIAFANYGRADRWRAIAKLNGIDDPLRVVPGTQLLLPTGNEARDNS